MRKRQRPSRLSTVGLAQDQGVTTLNARTRQHAFMRARFTTPDYRRELEAATGNDCGRVSAPYRVVLALRQPRKKERTAFDVQGPLAEPLEIEEGDVVEVDFKLQQKIMTRKFIILSTETLIDRVCRYITRAVCEVQACGEM